MAGKTDHVRVAIVILNHNGRQHLVECLESVFAISHADFEVILVDNASSDNSADLARSWALAATTPGSGRQEAHRMRRPSTVMELKHDRGGRLRVSEQAIPEATGSGAALTIVMCEVNLGYAGGHNVGIKLAMERGAPFVMLLNSDVIVSGDFLGPLLEAAAGDDRVGAVGPLVVSYWQPDMVWQAGASVLPARGWVRGRGHGDRADAWTGPPADVDALVGCAMLLKAETIRKVGLIDETYFLYMEETDWCTRARRGGWKCLVVPHSRVRHAESRLSAESKSAYSAYYFARNRLIFTAKNNPRYLVPALLWGMRYGLLNNLVRRRWPALWASILGTWDFLRGKRGMRPGLPRQRGPLPNLLVFTVDYKPQPGGIAEHAYKVASHMARLGVQVVVVAPRTGDFRRFDAPLDFKTYRVPRVALIGWLAYGAAAGYAILRHRIGLVYCATSHPCALVCVVLRALVSFRYTVTIHGHEVVYTATGLRQRIKRLLRPLQAGAIGSAYRVFAVSDFTRRSLVAAGIDAGKIAVIYNGVDVEDFEHQTPVDAVRERFGLAGKRIVLTVARLDAHKGHDMVLRALPEILAAVPDTVYVVTGLGGMRRRLEDLGAELGVTDRVVFTGHLPRPDVIALYKACEVFVMASRIQDGAAEGFGIAFIEAGAVGKPVVGGRSGGVPDAVADGVSGVLVDPEDPHDIARAVTRIMLDADLAGRLGNSGYRRVLGGFTWDHTVNRILASLEAGPARP
jgi:phosphatidylinositol alpha-1,6-mannosyltransferase